MENVYGSSFSVIPAGAASLKTYFPSNDRGAVSETSTDSVVAGATVVIEAAIALNAVSGVMTIATTGAVAALNPTAAGDIQFGEDGIVIPIGSQGTTSMKFSVPTTSLSTYMVIWRRV